MLQGKNIILKKREKKRGKVRPSKTEAYLLCITAKETERGFAPREN